MAIVDGLLYAVADSSGRLLLSPGQAPSLETDGRRTSLSTATLDAASVLGLLTEVAPDGDEPEQYPGSRWNFTYNFDGRDFEFSAVSTPVGWAASAKVAAVRPEQQAPSVLGSAEQQAPGAPRSAEQQAPPAQRPVAVFKKAQEGTPTTSIESLLRLLLERKASDLHLVAGQKPWLRIDGRLAPIEECPAPSNEELETLVDGIMEERHRSEFEATNDTDFALETGKARFRVNVFRDRLGAGAVFRHIPLDIPSFDDLGLPECLREVCYLNKGLVLVTGPTGSGKSTTLAAMVDLINRTRGEHIITIEDPVEFVHESRRCLINQREVGDHTGSFKRALRAALREDPDIVLVGEMRDLETVSMAIETAATGHLVFGTLHTTTAPATVERIIGQFPGDLQEQTRMMLSDSLRAVVAQNLLERKDGGRVAAFEILLGTPAVLNLIREGKTHQLPSAIQTGRALGMTNMTDSLLSLVDRQVVEPEEALRKAADKEALRKKFVEGGIRTQGPTAVAGEEPEPMAGEPLTAIA